MTSSGSATLMLNPVAHKASQIDLGATKQDLEAAGLTANVVVPDSLQASMDAIQASAERNDKLAFVAGGDGTLRVAAKMLAGTGTALAPVPAGTANVLAKELGIPRDWREAVQAHLSGQIVNMDIGWAGREPFLLMASVGWDAEVASQVSKQLKKRIGAAAYIVAGARRLGDLASPRKAVGTVDDEAVAGSLSLMVLSNTRNFGGVVEFTPDAIANDGLLDCCTVAPNTLLQEVQLAGRLLTHKLNESSWVHRGRASNVQIETHGITVQVDGDVIGETPMRFTVDKQALHISVPAGELPAILANPR